MEWFYFILLVLISFLLLIFFRLLFIIPKRNGKRKKSFSNTPRTTPVRTMIILGSGGHTSEMIKLLSVLDCGSKYSPRDYIVSNTDGHSINKIEQFEKEFKTRQEACLAMPNYTWKYTVHKIPRSREVGQSFLTAIFSTAWALLYSVPIVLLHPPELILCNGPGTCIPICAAGFLLKFCFFGTKIIYVESLARVESLSLSGKILYRFADRFIVQWPQLKEKYPRVEYIGRLV